MGDFIYLDHAATAPLDPAISRGLVEREATLYGNPASLHPLGRAAARAIEDARARIAATIGARAGEIVFTSGGTESLGLALLGGASRRPGRIAISAVEHAAVGQAATALAEQRGWTVDIIPVDGEGRVTPAALAAVIGRETRLVAVMLANNEVGTVNDLAALAPVVRTRSPRARLVVDAVQAAGKRPIDVAALECDALAFTAHKLHGPKGIGALWSRYRPNPLLVGGGQERGLRGGTLSAPLAWAFAEALDHRLADAARVEALRDRLWDRITARLPETRLTGAPFGAGRLGDNLHLCLPELPGEPLLNALAEAGVCASAGSACHRGRFSPTLAAMGRRAEEGAFVRLTVGRFTTEAEVDAAAERLAGAVLRLWALL